MAQEEPAEPRVLGRERRYPPRHPDGHQLVWDPPAALTSMCRWTCKTCGDAVLVRPDGSTYGGASERTCEESQAFWKRAAR